MRDLKNILQNAARLGTGKELVRKAVGKYLEPAAEAQRVLDWCEHNKSEIHEWLLPEQNSQWEEAQEFAERMKLESQSTLQELGVQLGGGGHYELLYFLTRIKKPESVVETGVAAGFSSKAILSAMAHNGHGRLYSSDFPYCRLERPEKYIGALVDTGLRERWSLHIKGDRSNLPIIASSLKLGSVELFHYDSDKSYSGREFAFRTLEAYLSPDCVTVFDDIQNNWHFRDLIESQNWDWRIFEFGGKFLGLIQKVSDNIE